MESIVMGTLKKKQQGAGGMGMLFTVAVIVTIAWVGLKAVPMYLEGSKIKNAMENIKAQPEAFKMSSKQVKDSLLKRLRIDNVAALTSQNYKEKAVYKRQGSGYTLTVQYLEFAPLAGGFDLAYNFNETIEVP